MSREACTGGCFGEYCYCVSASGTPRAYTSPHASIKLEVPRESALVEAERIVNGDRARDYGDAAENFGRIAALINAQYDTSFAAHDVAIILQLVKTARLRATPAHRDSWVDIAGYCELGARVAGA